jgi:hypothetical protein
MKGPPRPRKKRRESKRGGAKPPTFSSNWRTGSRRSVPKLWESVGAPWDQAVLLNLSSDFAGLVVGVKGASGGLLERFLLGGFSESVGSRYRRALSEDPPESAGEAPRPFREPRHDPPPPCEGGVTWPK